MQSSRCAWTHRSGQVHIRIDIEEYSFFVDCRPGHLPSHLLASIRYARQIGLEPLDPDEHEAEILDDGTIRIWLVPTVNTDLLYKRVDADIAYWECLAVAC